MKDTKISFIFSILTLVLIFINLFLFAPRTTGGGNKEINDIIFSFVIVPFLVLEYFFYFFKPLERFEKEKPFNPR